MDTNPDVCVVYDPLTELPGVLATVVPANVILPPHPALLFEYPVILYVISQPCGTVQLILSASDDCPTSRVVPEPTYIIF